MENPYEKNHPTIDLLFPLAKLGQADQPPGPGQVSLHHSTLDTLQWSITNLLKDFITCNPQALKPWAIKTMFEVHVKKKMKLSLMMKRTNSTFNYYIKSC
jgi:hypothetical protein